MDFNTNHQLLLYFFKINSSLINAPITIEVVMTTNKLKLLTNKYGELTA